MTQLVKMGGRAGTKPRYGKIGGGVGTRPRYGKIGGGLVHSPPSFLHLKPILLQAPSVPSCLASQVLMW